MSETRKLASLGAARTPRHRRLPRRRSAATTRAGARGSLVSLVGRRVVEFETERVQGAIRDRLEHDGNGAHERRTAENRVARRDELCRRSYPCGRTGPISRERRRVRAGRVDPGEPTEEVVCRPAPSAREEAPTMVCRERAEARHPREDTPASAAGLRAPCSNINDDSRADERPVEPLDRTSLLLEHRQRLLPELLALQIELVVQREDLHLGLQVHLVVLARIRRDPSPTMRFWLIRIHGRPATLRDTRARGLSRNERIGVEARRRLDVPGQPDDQIAAKSR